MNNELLVGFGIVLIIVFAGFAFLFYRQEYFQKRVARMESALTDIQVSLDGFLSEDAMPHQPVPITSVVPVMEGMPSIAAPEPLGSAEAEALPEDTFYASVLNQAHEEAGETEKEESPSVEAVLEGFEREVGEVPVVGAGGMDIATASGAGVSYEGMTKGELLALVEKRGVRVKKTANKNEIISILRRTETAQNREDTTGSENVSGPGGSLFPAAASMDGEFAVDLGQSEEISSERLDGAN
jgi:hypothetical protein